MPCTRHMRCTSPAHGTQVSLCACRGQHRRASRARLTSRCTAEHSAPWQALGWMCAKISSRASSGSWDQLVIGSSGNAEAGEGCGAGGRGQLDGSSGCTWLLEPRRGWLDSRS